MSEPVRDMPEFMDDPLYLRKKKASELAAPAGSAFAMHVVCEIERARRKHKPINSAHEGYSVILEELEEFWGEVKKKRELRDERHMYEELVQIAAMAQRTAEDVIDRPNAPAHRPARTEKE